MTRLLWLLWLALLTVGGCANHEPPAQARAPEAASAANAPKAQPQLLMWTVRPSASATEPAAYLLGSIHVATADLYPLDARIDDAFTHSDHLVLETNPSDPKAADLMADFVRDSMLPKGESIFATLERKLAERLKQRFVQLDADPERFAGFKLWFVSMSLSMLELSRAGFTGDNGIDAHFQALAEKRKLPLLTLEPLEAQMQLLVNMGADATAQDLSLALETDTVAELKRMTDHWRRGSSAGLAAELDEMRTKAPLAFDALFTQRNRTMAAGLDKMLHQAGHYFVVVGAGHLVGKGSVVDELRAKGYAVDQL
jgi:uncharacterized protein YbaP (TraB family)